MKKISLICAVAIAGLSLTACGNGNNYNLKKLRAEHSRLLKQTKRKGHKQNKKHSTKSKKSTKQNASQKSSNQNSISSNQNKQQSINNHNNTNYTPYSENHAKQDAEAHSQAYDNDAWKGTIYENMSPEDRYNYQKAQVERGAQQDREAGISQ